MNQSRLQAVNSLSLRKGCSHETEFRRRQPLTETLTETVLSGIALTSPTTERYQSVNGAFIRLLCYRIRPVNTVIDRSIV